MLTSTTTPVSVTGVVTSNTAGINDLPERPVTTVLSQGAGASSTSAASQLPLSVGVEQQLDEVERLIMGAAVESDDSPIEGPAEIKAKMK